MKLFLFNPENDLALANADPNFIPPRSARTMAADLSVLPAWWAGEGDAVWTPSPRQAEAFVQMQGGRLPRLEWYAGGAPPVPDEICPWGWNPMLLRTLRRWGFPETLLLSEEQMADYRRLSGRQTAVALLADVRHWATGAGQTVSGWCCGEALFCTREEEIVYSLARWPGTMLKAPWSGSGKGLRLGAGGWRPPLSGWCRNLLAGQGGVVVEPLYKKVMDFAMEFYSDGVGAVDYCGLSLFVTTGQGAYQGSAVMSEALKKERLHRLVPSEVCGAVRDFLAGRLRALLGTRYRGFLGVDMMVCRQDDGAGLCIHPCVEVNLRTTMGMVSVWLARRLAEGSEAEFRVDYDAQPGGLLADHERRRAAAPLVSADGRWVAGYCPLTPVEAHTHYRAWMQVRRAGDG